jgi:hypothetical protein
MPISVVVVEKKFFFETVIFYLLEKFDKEWGLKYVYDLKNGAPIYKNPAKLR